MVDRETYERIKAATLASVRGTVQADQAQVVQPVVPDSNPGLVTRLTADAWPTQTAKTISKKFKTTRFFRVIELNTSHPFFQNRDKQPLS